MKDPGYWLEQIWRVLAQQGAAALPVVLQGSSQHIGQVGGETVVVSVTPTVSAASAYASGDLVGGKLSFANAVRTEGGRLETVTITDLGNQSAVLDLVLFDSDPSATIFTDNAALDIADADLVKVVGVARVITYYSANDNSVGVEPNAGIRFKPASGTTLYGALVTRSTPTYASTGDLTVRLGILQD